MTVVRIAVVAAVLWSSVARGEAPPPERLLPATTQVYIRWDGIPAHRDRYSQVTVGRLLESDLAGLLKYALDAFPRSLQHEFVDGKLLDGVAPARLAELQADVVRAGRLTDMIATHGVIAAAEVGPMPNVFALAIGAAQRFGGKADGRGNPIMPKIRVTVIVPNAGQDREIVASALRLQSGDDGTRMKKESIAGRSVDAMLKSERNVLLWDEFGHLVIVVTNDDPAAVVASATAGENRIADHPLFRRVTEFREFPTDLRAFADLRGLMKPAKQALGLASFVTGGIGKKVDEFGLDSFESFAYYCGFDGSTRREVAELDTAADRKGVARLLGGAPVTWDQLPPMPPDVAKWSAHRLSPAQIYDYWTRYADLFRAPGDDSDPAADAYDKASGIAVKPDLLDHLGDLVVTYQSPAEGAIAFGQVLAVRVKDAQKVEMALDQIVQTVSASATVKLKKRPFLGANIREVQVQNRPGFVFLPSYVVHNDWLVISLFPQPLQSFVQRSAGQAKAWSPDETAKGRFAQLPACSTWGYTDLRPSTQQALTFAPLILEAMQAFSTGNGFDVGTLPSASTINQKLTPSVTGVHDNGRCIRWDARGGLLLPGDSLGVDPLMLFLAGQILGN